MFSCLVLLIWFLWGIYSQTKWQQKYSNWQTKKIALVQPNRISSFSVVPLPKGFSKEYPPEMAATKEIAKQNPLIVIWPEGSNYFYQISQSVQSSFQKFIAQFEVNLLFADIQYNKGKAYNSMFWLNENGLLKDIYNKRSLVPFGEFLPFQKYYASILKLFNFPFSRFYPGKEAKIFNIEGLKIAPLICYESIIAETAAASIKKNSAGKVFVVVTNNGWYRSKYQVQAHSALSSMRAIENRVPLIHVINNGFSSVTMPDGKVVFKTPYLKAGAWLFDLPFNKNSGGSFYSQYYGWFENVIKIFIFSLIIYYSVKFLVNKLKQQANKNKKL